MHSQSLTWGTLFEFFGAAPKSLATARGIIATMVQGFFTYQIYAFKKLHIPIFSWPLSFVCFRGITAIFGTVLPMKSVHSYEAQWLWLLTTVWYISTSNDFTITTALVANLLSHWSRIHKRTVSLIDKLVVWTIETGMLTKLGSLFVTMKDNYTWGTPLYAVIWVALYTIIPGPFLIPHPQSQLQGDAPHNERITANCKISEILKAILGE
ncbi:hypothetical protein DFH08DRAFT_813473 [Mycena albidolilacea]|uniref:DUF6534 domain-containing protein n=1 Tax=Mycena albidolilacea TaxID=1033008 RepID=A0AAD6ZRW7_9AGAR|nr:hypothetical protein DFH08DRAFT_813473 [Mycena albidolilacea]